jgi:hypothetical protein
MNLRRQQRGSAGFRTPQSPNSPVALPCGGGKALRKLQDIPFFFIEEELQRLDEE